MIAVGIPSYNESDNIKLLAKKLDDFAVQSKEQIIIINADNNSPDGTSEVFLSTNTRNRKVAIKTDQPGKGRNVLEILRYVSKHDIQYCMLIDADVTSLSPEWLHEHIKQAAIGTDYVVPNYARYMHEGNTTNHFSYPLLYAWTDGKSPRQPIAGDFGLSNRLAAHLVKASWQGSDFRYGVDMLMTMRALSNGFKIREISLTEKIHKPSFDKMINIITDEAESYYRLSKPATRPVKVDFVGTVEDRALIKGKGIPDSQIQERRLQAQALHTADNMIPSSHSRLPDSLDIHSWAAILLEHERLVGKISPEKLAKSVCPYFLIRTLTYLAECDSPEIAAASIHEQAELIRRNWLNDVPAGVIPIQT